MPVNEIIHADCLETKKGKHMLPTLYLVRIRHTMDDVPVFVTDSKSEAIEFAKETTFDLSDEVMSVTTSSDCSTPCAIDIVEFVEGRPVNTTVIRVFYDEPEEEPAA